jgi:hypothetical protein
VPPGTYRRGGFTHYVLMLMPTLDMVAVMLRNRTDSLPGFLYNRDYPVFVDLVAAAVDDV